MPPKQSPAIPVLLLGAIALSSGCKKDEEVPTLFDEDGVWSLVQHDADATGTVSDVDSNTRKDAFLLRYKASENVVQTAMCGEADTDTPANSICRISANATWRFCNCFGYAFERNQQLWQEFTAGDVPPEVTFEEMDPPADDGGTATGTATATATGGGSGGPAPGGPGTTINISEVTQVSDTFQYRPLPMGIFGSDGLSSAYVFQKKAPQLWDTVECDPCI